MPTIGWFEILLVVAVAIIVIGPKDFPFMLKKVGSWIGTTNITTIAICQMPILICFYTSFNFIIKETFYFSSSGFSVPLSISSIFS